MRAFIGMDDKLLSYACVCALLLLTHAVAARDTTMHIPAATATNHPDTTTTNVTLMYADLHRIPPGGDAVVHLNLGYNHLQRLENFTFVEQRYRRVRRVYLFRNAIARVGVRAFAGLQQLETLDLSDNNITALAADTFTGNGRLKDLLLANNAIRFERGAPFLRSRSLQTLVLSGNRITDVYDATFVGVPALKRLLLTDNRHLVALSPACFRHVRKLRYLSLANSGVHRLRVEMFAAPLPRVVDVRDTPLADTFDPPLTQLTAESFVELARVDLLIQTTLLD